MMLAVMTTHAEQNNIVLLPKPNQMVVGEGSFKFKNPMQVQAPADHPAAEKALSYLSKVWEKDTGGSIRRGGAAEAFRLIHNPAYADEAYRLTVTDDGIAIEASGYAGYFYGIQSLRQVVLSGNPGLAEKSGHSIFVPKVDIADTPRYGYRGFMLDSARNFQSAESIKRYLDYLAFIKINRFHWHLVDSQGWRIEIKKYPELIEQAAWRGEGEDREGGYYSHEQIRDIVAYAKERNITIIPEIEMPAHSDCVLYTYPKLSCFGETVDDVRVVHLHHFLKKDQKNRGYIPPEKIEKGQIYKIPRNYCAGKEEVFEFLQNVLVEVMELFDGPYIHVGGDERVANRWPLCPDCRARMAEHGLENDDQLQKYFMERIISFIHGHGRQAIMWAEHPEHGIPEDVIVQAWRGKESDISTKAGHDVINSSNPYRYLDYFEYEHQKGTHWLPKMSMEKAYNFESYPEEQKKDRGKIIGTEAPLWTSWVEEHEVEEYMFPRLLAVAEDGWFSGGTGKDFEEFNRRVQAFEPVFATLGARYAKPLSEVPVQLILPANVESSMAPWKSFVPEMAFDRSLYHYFWSEKPPVKGDKFSIELESPRSVGRVRVYSGQTNAEKHALKNAVLEISEDEVRFTQIGEFKGQRKLAVNFDREKKIKVLRIRFVKSESGETEEREGTVIIRGIILD
ncbi:beta-N-acetylhexosaminidase [Haloferula sp.]|uniref:beta-N-acetylhexosaminidase n=1 Tax=Haloferula sp. TaxID=2497595 RepID=UPI00329E5C8B